MDGRNYNLEILAYLKPENIFKDKNTRREKVNQVLMNSMIKRTSRIFKWEGLPDTISQRVLELQLQSRGHVGIIKHEDKLYALHGGLGGKPNYNYMPTWYIVSNPYLNIVTHTYYIYDEKEHEKDVVIIPNDSLYEGIIPLLSFHTELLTDIQLTKRCVYIWKRMPNLLTAPDNNSYSSLKDMLKELDDGELDVIFDRNYMQNIGAVDLQVNGRNDITQLLEAEQYQKAALFNDLGLQLNYNMKRETITSSEAQLGEGSLLPLVDDMLEQRQIACEEVNKLFGTEWSVDFTSAWKNLHKSIETELEKEEAEVENLENPPEEAQNVEEASTQSELEESNEEEVKDEQKDS